VIIYGTNPVLEALRAGRVCTVRVISAFPKMVEVRRLAEEAGVPITRAAESVLDQVTQGARHQGIVAELTPPQPITLEQLIGEARHPALLVVLDGIEDPQNLGAVLRSAEAAGVDGVVRQTRRSAPPGRVAKASAGALAYVRLVSVVNIARALTTLRDAGVWTVGLEADGEDLYRDVDLTQPTAFVLGSEGRGLRRLVRERCDRVVSIPMAGRINSLNVSVAAGIGLFEARRQRLAVVDSR